MKGFFALISAAMLFVTFSSAANDDTNLPAASTIPAPTSIPAPAQSATSSIPYGNDLAKLKAAGFTDNDLSAWKAFATANYCQADDSSPPVTTCTIDVDTLVQWKATALGPSEASLWSDNGLSPKGAKLVDATFKHSCKGTLAKDLGHQNPYSVKNKCFLLTGYSTLQLLSAHVALASPAVGLGDMGGLGAMAQALGASDPKNVEVSFGSRKYAPAEGAPINALVIGAGALQYNSAEGSLETVAKVTVLIDLSDDN